MLLYIIRHGDPIYDPDSLTPLGHKQAKALVPRLAPLGFDKIFVSPMIRAQQTAAPTCEALNMKPEIREFLSENDLFSKMSMTLPVDIQVEDENGEKTYKTIERMRWCFHQQTTNFRTAESYHMTDDWHTLPAFADCKTLKGAYDEFIKASDEFLCELGYVREGDHYRIENPKYERVAVFCHQGVGLTWISHMLAIPPHIMWGSFDITHSAVSVLEFKNHQNGITLPMCLCLSDTSHIFHAGLPMKYQGELPF